MSQPSPGNSYTEINSDYSSLEISQNDVTYENLPLVRGNTLSLFTDIMFDIAQDRATSFVLIGF